MTIFDPYQEAAVDAWPMPDSLRDQIGVMAAACKKSKLRLNTEPGDDVHSNAIRNLGFSSLSFAAKRDLDLADELKLMFGIEMNNLADATNQLLSQLNGDDPMVVHNQRLKGFQEELSLILEHYEDEVVSEEFTESLTSFLAEILAASLMLAGSADQWIRAVG